VLHSFQGVPKVFLRRQSMTRCPGRLGLRSKASPRRLGRRRSVDGAGALGEQAAAAPRQRGGDTCIWVNRRQLHLGEEAATPASG
jgi:hypothetical protein